jgi:hypothetical protein
MFSYECIPPNSQGVRCGDDFCLTWQLPSAAQVAFSFPTFVQNQKKLTATYGFIKATSQEERNASPISTSD